MHKLALIGSGLSRTRMPRLQIYLGELAGVPVDYQVIDTDTLDDFCLETEVKRRADMGYRGLNITHPYKQRVVPMVQPMSSEIVTIGAMNTLLFDTDGWKGTTTDYTGFKHGYRHQLKGSQSGRVLIAGGGGVGRAIAFGLGDLGAEHLHIFDTDAGQATRLVDALSRSGFAASVVSAPEFVDCMAGVDGLVNATPLGMHKYPGTAFPVSRIGTQNWVFDAVYTPLNTEFITASRAAGLAILTGYDLWFFQGLDAFELFTGVNIDCDLAMKEALSWLD